MSDAVVGTQIRKKVSRLDLAEILQLPPMEWRVEHLLPRNGIMMLGGAQKTGKSRLLTHGVVRLLQGRSMFGVDGWGPGQVLTPKGTSRVAVRRVLYYNAEGGVEAMRMRSPLFETADILDVQSMVSVDDGRFCLVGQNGLVDHRLVMDLIEDWRHFDLVVLDPMVSFHGVDENDNTRMNYLMDLLRDIAVEADVGIVIVHHTSKPKEEDTVASAKGQKGTKLRGASAIPAAADASVVAWNAGGGDLTLVFELRYHEPHSEVVLAPDRRNGRFYRRVVVGRASLFVPDPADWCQDNDHDPNEYAAAFGMTKDAARETFKEANL